MAAAQLEMNNSVRASTTHLVVEFNVLQQKSTELVLRNWVYFQKGHWYCKYPAGTEMQFVEKYVRENLEPKKNWKAYRVKILTQAGNYDQGIRRLNRYLDGADSLNSAQQMSDELVAQSSHVSEGQSNSKKNPQSKEYNTNYSFEGNKSCSESCHDTDSIINGSNTFSDEMDETLILRENIRRANTNQNNKIRKNQKENNTRSDADAYLKESLAQLKTQMDKIERKVSRVEKSILYEMKEQFSILKASFASVEGLKSVGDTIAKCLEALNTEFPLNTFEEFMEFDNSFKYEGEDEEVKRISEEKRKALKTWMKLTCNGCKSEKEAIYKVLLAVMKKPVQLKFSGSGRKIKGQGKENFSSTKVFECMADILVESYPCNKDTIKSIAGKWLAGAADRDGGKKHRSMSQEQS